VKNKPTLSQLLIPLILTLLLSAAALRFIFPGKPVRGEVLGWILATCNFAVAVLAGLLGMRAGVRGYFLIIVASGIFRIIFLLAVTVLVMFYRREWFSPYLFSLFSGFFVYLIAELAIFRRLGAKENQ